MRCVHDRGVTLVELLVVLALLGLVFGVSGLALASLAEPRDSAAVSELRHARAEAIRSGEAVGADSVLFLPDGRAIGPGVDPLTGAPNAR
ncbi:MAG TPA: prepilin-type N-terminal cleavage/methylation domain-containing protein [Gemmatimonadales bacterium]|jgi:prepilin-type N-terminal cleavage/methylation domain-containing protein|nr:prepilin-type N-terminal cleavage/methylation domain-containing protein [Gemmatimonadales bacterium]